MHLPRRQRAAAASGTDAARRTKVHASSLFSPPAAPGGSFFPLPAHARPRARSPAAEAGTKKREGGGQDGHGRDWYGAPLGRTARAPWGPPRSARDRRGLARTGTARTGTARTGSARTGSARTGSARTGSARRAAGPSRAASTARGRRRKARRPAAGSRSRTRTRRPPAPRAARPPRARAPPAQYTVVCQDDAGRPSCSAGRCQSCCVLYRCVQPRRERGHSRQRGAARPRPLPTTPPQPRCRARPASLRRSAGPASSQFVWAWPLREHTARTDSEATPGLRRCGGEARGRRGRRAG